MDGAITLHAAAPAKPELGEACTGCGACCTFDTCPLGRVTFLRRGGQCPALRWNEPASRYRRGLAEAPGDYLRWLPQWSRHAVGRLVARSIAVDYGCDFDSTVV
jgi:hypothetical protein